MTICRCPLRGMNYWGRASNPYSRIRSNVDLQLGYGLCLSHISSACEKPLFKAQQSLSIPSIYRSFGMEELLSKRQSGEVYSKSKRKRGPRRQATFL